MKKALMTGITGQDDVCLAPFLLNKGCHGCQFRLAEVIVRIISRMLKMDR